MKVDTKQGFHVGRGAAKPTEANCPHPPLCELPQAAIVVASQAHKEGSDIM